MIDSIQRRRYARLLRALATGRLTNFEYEDAVDKTVDLKKDLAIEKIYDMAWFLYDDINEQRLRGEWGLTPECRRAVATWLLFLYSDLEFSKAKIKEPDVWPFPTKQALDDCKSKPVRFFCGEESLPSGIKPFKTGRLSDDENMESFRHRVVPAACGALVVSFLIWRKNAYSPGLILPLSGFALAITILFSASFSYKPLDSIHITIWQFLFGLVLIIGTAVCLGLYVF